MYTKLMKWAKDYTLPNGLVMVKALWSGRSALEFSNDVIKLPVVFATKKAQPFTLAVVLNPGLGYRNLDTGEWTGTQLAPGDVVIAKQFVAYDLELQGNKINYLPENSVLAKVKGIDLDQLKHVLVDL